MSLKRIFKNLGAEAVISSPGAPSIKELLTAIEELPVKNLIILPNDGNIILAAEQAQRLAKKPVFIIPARTIPEGINALLALNLEEPC